jgi:hypothetical protein
LSQPLTCGEAATDGAGSTGHFEAPYKKGTHRKPGKSFPCTNIFIGLRDMVFFGGGKIAAIAHAYSVVIPLRTLAKHSKRFTPLLAAPAALLLGQEQAQAVLTYNIFESAGNVAVQTSGSLNLTGATVGPQPETEGCTPGGITSSVAAICTGLRNNIRQYVISGPSAFNGSGATQNASSVSGINTIIVGIVNSFAIDSTYVSTTPIVSSATFNGQTLASLGFTTTGLIGTWSLVGTSETINVILGNPPAAAVPGPLPLFGAAAAFGWSRRLRKRIAAPLSTPPQA